MDSRQIEAEAARWLVRSDKPDFSDHAALAAWLASDTAHRVAWLRLKSAWQAAARLHALNQGVEAPTAGPRNFQALRHPARKSPTPDWRRHWLVAASVAAVALLALVGWQRYVRVDRQHYATTIGALESVPLADGSVATLGSDSQMQVAYSFAQREITLQQGEAYFVVAKDATRPFVVRAGPHDVVAVGTRFSVRRSADGLRVIVTQGVVRLESSGDHPAPASLLPAGSMAVVNADGTLTRKLSPQALAHALDWRRGYIYFRDTPLSEAVAELNRYHRHKIVIADPTIAALRIGGNFQWTNTEAFIRLLEQAFPVTARNSDGNIVLHAR